MKRIIPFVFLILFSTHLYSSASHSNVADDIAYADARIIKLTLVDNMFLPSEITVSEGETIRFVIKNGGNKKHEVLIGSLDFLNNVAKSRRKFPEKEHTEENLVQLDPGEQKELIWEFSTAGNIEFACPLPGHFKKMRGIIHVEKK